MSQTSKYMWRKIPKKIILIVVIMAIIIYMGLEIRSLMIRLDICGCL